MKTIAIALGALITAAAAGSVFAESDRNTPFDPQWAAREQAREVYRNNYGSDDNRWRDERPRYYRESRDTHRECWNPRARHFENVREGEFQDDLDYSRCRVVSEGRSR